MRGVVLDFDGVLVRSMERHAEAYRRVLVAHGVEVRDEDVFAREGARSETILHELLLGAGRTAPAEVDLAGLAHEKQRIFADLGRPPLYPGAEAMVRRIREAAGRLGLVTGTRRENLEPSLGPLLGLFDAVLAQDAYGHDKPHPEPYLRSATAIGLAPARCAAVENAPRGVASAKGAGFARVVALTTTLSAAPLAAAGADVVVADHAAAADEIVRWCAS